jgi:peptidoglycan/xylan/chitin deacetylase (PgdA/CDA1 family)
MVRDAGHEIGLHGYSHENPVDMTLEQQRDVLDKTFRMLTDFCGKPPRGSVAPWWETSAEGMELLLDYVSITPKPLSKYPVAKRDV